jgi:hypothetical protein
MGLGGPMAILSRANFQVTRKVRGEFFPQASQRQSRSRSALFWLNSSLSAPRYIIVYLRSLYPKYLWTLTTSSRLSASK